jgi:hypothetical protein
MPEHENFLVFTKPLDDMGLKYMVTGSVASIIYGEPRLTHDIDLVLELPEKSITNLIAAFDEELFYCPASESIRIEARREQRGHFNIIHHQSGLKADIYLSGNHPLHQWAMGKRRQVSLGPSSAKIWVAPPEYVIVRKLEFFFEGGSKKHIQDIRGILELSKDLVDFGTVEHWVEKMGLDEQWQLAKKR